MQEHRGDLSGNVFGWHRAHGALDQMALLSKTSGCTHRCFIHFWLHGSLSHKFDPRLFTIVLCEFESRAAFGIYWVFTPETQFRTGYLFTYNSVLKRSVDEWKRNEWLQFSNLSSKTAAHAEFATSQNVQMSYTFSFFNTNVIFCIS